MNPNFEKGVWLDGTEGSKSFLRVAVSPDVVVGVRPLFQMEAVALPPDNDTKVVWRYGLRMRIIVNKDASVEAMNLKAVLKKVFAEGLPSGIVDKGDHASIAFDGVLGVSPKIGVVDDMAKKLGEGMMQDDGPLKGILDFVDKFGAVWEYPRTDVERWILNANVKEPVAWIKKYLAGAGKGGDANVVEFPGKNAS